MGVGRCQNGWFEDLIKIYRRLIRLTKRSRSYALSHSHRQEQLESSDRRRIEDKEGGCPGISQTAGLSWATLAAVGLVIELLVLEIALFRQLRSMGSKRRPHRHPRHSKA
jgi:hypothetical protein